MVGRSSVATRTDAARPLVACGIVSADFAGLAAALDMPGRPVSIKQGSRHSDCVPSRLHHAHTLHEVINPRRRGSLAFRRHIAPIKWTAFAVIVALGFRGRSWAVLANDSKSGLNETEAAGISSAKAEAMCESRA